MISIIITAYNVEKTIAKAIQSCLDQTYSDLEILIINDCSTDSTLKVVQSFNDSRIRVISNEINQGAGLARRRGTKEAKGEYTSFLDGDDFIESDFIETLYNAAKKYNADVVSSGINFLEHAPMGYDKEEVLDSSNKFEVSNTLTRFLNNKIIKRDIWDKVDYSPRRYIEDTQTCYFVLFFANTIVNLQYIGYNYTENPTSLCHSASNIKTLIYQALCAKDLCEFVAEHKKEELNDFLQAFALRLRFLGNAELPDSIRDEYKDELAELFTFFLQNITF